MKTAAVSLALILALTLPQLGCRREAHPLTPQEALQLTEATEGDEELQELITRFRRSGEVRHRAADGTTMLHLACATGNAPLMQHLLAAGADVEADSAAFGRPLTTLFMRLAENADTQEFLQLADILRQAGARLYGSSVIVSDGLDEATYLYLLQRFPAGQDDEAGTALPAASMGWQKALAYCLEHTPHPLQGAARRLLHCVAENDTMAPGRPGYLACAELLLQHGLAADETAEAEDEITPLLLAARDTQMTDRDHGDEPGLAVITYLIQQGANPCRCSKDGDCPYDYLAAHRHALEAAGVTLPPPAPLDFTEGTELLLNVLRADMRQEPTEHLRTAFGQIAAVLHPTPEMQAWQHNEAAHYAAARLAAIRLLYRADAVQAAAAVAAMPAWADDTFFPETADETAQGTATERLADLLQQLHELHLTLPAPVILHLADRLCERGTPLATDTAASATELLAYGEDTDALLGELRQDPRPAVQAGAWQATLLRKGLPAAKVNDVAGWLSDRGHEADTPALRRALRLTELDKLWEGELTPEKAKQVFDDMKEIGAEQAAELYRNLTAEEDTEFTPETANATYALETATARYILEHEADFRAVEAAARRTAPAESSAEKENPQIAD